MEENTLKSTRKEESESSSDNPREVRSGDVQFNEGNYYLPHEPLLGFVVIPEGAFLMGSDKSKDRDAAENEFPQHKVELPKYYIGRYPVTVEQYRKFVEESGYINPNPRTLDSPNNHPVIFVTWHDAIAYCTWLDESLRRSPQTPAILTKMFLEGCRVTLPSEAEWEKAARGVDGRIYPWGDIFDADKANTKEKGINDPSEVGRFPTGASPYGVLDMCGNVCEWTRSFYGVYDYPYPAEGKEREAGEDLKINGYRFIRGGCYFYDRKRTRCAYRTGENPYNRNGFNGFRVVLCHGPL
jgi:formylglycine-generating enzyme required for sulfatase activity